MTKPTIIRSIKEASRLNPEPSKQLEKKLNIQISMLTMKQCDLSISIKSDSIQTVTNSRSNGAINLSNNHTCLCNKEIEYLKREIHYLKAALEDKGRLIAFLEQNQNN